MASPVFILYAFITIWTFANVLNIRVFRVKSSETVNESPLHPELEAENSDRVSEGSKDTVTITKPRASSD